MEPSKCSHNRAQRSATSEGMNRAGWPVVKRRTIQEAFIGEPTGDPRQSLDNYAEGEEAVDIEVRGGKVQLVVPAGTPDGQVFEAHTFLGGELELEDGRV